MWNKIHFFLRINVKNYIFSGLVSEIKMCNPEIPVAGTFIFLWILRETAERHKIG